MHNNQANSRPQRAKVTFKPSVSQPNTIPKEIARLKADLETQMLKLHQQRVDKDKRRRRQVPSEIYWEEDEQEERTQQRQEEQMARNARMMYDLSQQVKLDHVHCSFL